MSSVRGQARIKHRYRSRSVALGLVLLTLSVVTIAMGCGSGSLPQIDAKEVAGVEVEAGHVLSYQDAQAYIDAIISAYNDASPASFSTDTTPEYFIRLTLSGGRHIGFMFTDSYPVDSLVVSWPDEDDGGQTFIEVKAPGLESAVRELLVAYGYSEPPAELNLAMAELVKAVAHKVYWLGSDFEGRTLTESGVSGTGVVTLQYGDDPGGPFEPGASPVIKLYEYVGSELDQEILSNIEAQLIDAREVQGSRGTYTLYDTASNGMPVVKVVVGDVVIQVVDVWEGDVDLMVSAADALVEASDR